MAKDRIKSNVEPGTIEARAENLSSESGLKEAPAILPRMGYSVDETAQMLGINQGTVYRLLQRGLLRSASGLRTKVIPLKEIERFLNN